MERNYKNKFLKFREFLVKMYKKTGTPDNWLIDRLNFTLSVSRTFNELSLKSWADKLKFWEDEGGIFAVVNSECEASGEAFFQIDRKKIDEKTINKMFGFAEKRLFLTENEEKILQLRINEKDKKIEEIAENRGYKKLDWQEFNSEFIIEEKLENKIIKGFRIENAYEITMEAKALVHSRAFGHKKLNQARRGFEELLNFCDYRKDLDLFMINDDGRVVSFCGFWYDEINKIGIIEPLGTIKEYRGLGIAKSLVYEGINKLREEGAEKIYVGSNQKFYKKIGFKECTVANVWEKRY